MKILKLVAENVKKLRAVEITPAGDIVTISGKNGAGKTSVLDSIWWALAGTSNIQKQPIRRGAERARIRLDLGDLVVERRFTANGSTLYVENAEGARYQSPQKMLDALIGELSFDPLAFARMAPRDQFDELRRIAKLDVDLEELDAANLRDYQTRTVVNRQAKEKRAQASAITIAVDLPETPIDESSLLDRVEDAARANSEVEQMRLDRERLGRDLTDLEKSAGEKRTRAVELRQRAEQLELEAGLIDEEVLTKREFLAETELPRMIDVAAVRAELEAARATNRELAVRKKRDDILAEAAQLEGESRQLSEAMDSREQQKRDAIMRAALPVEGLGFGSGFVTFKGVPFDQSSSAEQLRVSLAIAMAANPKLRVIRIQDGSLLDEESVATIASMARENDYQIWMEVVDSSGRLGITIEDGLVRGAELQEIEGAA